MDANCSLAANICQGPLLAQNTFGVWHRRTMQRYPHDAFGHRLEKLIAESPHADEPQRRLGMRFGVSGPTVNEWLKGKKLPGMENAIRIATELNCCVEFLLTGRGPKRPAASDDNGDSGIEEPPWETLPPEERARLRRLYTRLLTRSLTIKRAR